MAVSANREYANSPPMEPVIVEIDSDGSIIESTDEDGADPPEME